MKSNLKSVAVLVATSAAFAAINYTIIHNPLIFAITFVLIAHELGHYFAAHANGAQADIPYIIPLPFIGIGVTRSGLIPGSAGKGVITLNYQEVLEISQPFATRIENVTPYFVTVYEGIMDLNPSSDFWVDRTQLAPITVEGITAEMTSTTLQLTREQIDTQGGWSPIIWNAWSDQWTGSL